MSAEDLAALLPPAPATPMGTPGGGAGDRQGSDQKRRKLRHYDLLPSQLLNSMGASGIEHVPMEELWRSMCAGNKVAEAFSELCFDDAARHGVALSRFAEVMSLAIERLTQTAHYQACLKDEIWRPLVAEAEDMLPAFKAIDAGRGVADASASTSIRRVAYQRPTQDPGDLTPHVERIYAWLTRPHSTLRAVIALLSAGGLFYVGQCHDKGVRAWLHSGGGSQQAMQTAVTSRRPVAAAAPSDDLSGLTQLDD